MSTQQMLSATLPMVAIALSQRYGIKVIIGHSDNASTDGRVINLPALPSSDDLAYTIAHGYIDHEVAHIKFTDFDVFAKSVKTSYLEGTLCNLIEDIRIEKQMSGIFPGCSINLKRLAHLLVEDGSLEAPSTKDNELTCLLKFMMYYLRRHVLNQATFEEYDKQATSIARDVLPQGTFTKLVSLMSRASTLRNTRESAELAADVIAMLEDEKQKAETPEKQEKTENAAMPDSQQNTASQTDDSCTDTKLDETSQESSGDTPVGRSASEKQCETADIETKSNATHGLNNEEADPDAVMAIKNILEGKANDDKCTSDIGSVLKDKLDSLECKKTDAIVVGEAGSGGYSLKTGDGNALFTDALRYSSALRPRLMGLLQSYRRRFSRPASKGRRIALKAIHKIVMNDPNIFLKKSPVTEVNTAISILLDCSTSMRRVMRTANLSVMSIAHALDLIDGVSTGVSVFPGHTNTDIDVITQIGEPVAANRNRFVMQAGGGTPMAAAMWRAAANLMLTPQTRKIMLVITDGEANSRDVKSIETLIAAAGNSGMEIMALGIGNLQIANKFPTHQTITSIDELANAMFNMLKDKLLTAA